MSYLEKARTIRAAMDTAGEVLTDEQALASKGIYRQWSALVKAGYTAEKAGFRFLYGSDLYKTAQPGMSFQAQWVPGEGTESMYTRVDEAHAGTLEDPVPYSGNMELQEGLYYTQGGVVYLCTRSTGTAVYNALSELVGVYVEVAEAYDDKSQSGLLSED